MKRTYLFLLTICLFVLPIHASRMKINNNPKKSIQSDKKMGGLSLKLITAIVSYALRIGLNLMDGRELLQSLIDNNKHKEIPETCLLKNLRKKCFNSISDTTFLSVVKNIYIKSAESEWNRTKFMKKAIEIQNLLSKMTVTEDKDFYKEMKNNINNNSYFPKETDFIIPIIHKPSNRSHFNTGLDELKKVKKEYIKNIELIKRELMGLYEKVYKTPKKNLIYNAVLQ